VPAASLDTFLAEQLRGRKLPVPIRVTGLVSELRWHVVDGSRLPPGAGHAEHVRTGSSGTLTDAKVELVGFFSTEHQGVFTHHGASSHFHVLTPQLTGHVDAVALRAGARLWLPER
jgi:acetolactate decarboxylase